MRACVPILACMPDSALACFHVFVYAFVFMRVFTFALACVFCLFPCVCFACLCFYVCAWLCMCVFHASLYIYAVFRGLLCLQLFAKVELLSFSLDFYCNKIKNVNYNKSQNA